MCSCEPDLNSNYHVSEWQETLICLLESLSPTRIAGHIGCCTRQGWLVWGSSSFRQCCADIDTQRLPTVMHPVISSKTKTVIDSQEEDH